MIDSFLAHYLANPENTDCLVIDLFSEKSIGLRSLSESILRGDFSAQDRDAIAQDIKNNEQAQDQLQYAWENYYKEFSENIIGTLRREGATLAQARAFFQTLINLSGQEITCLHINHQTGIDPHVVLRLLVKLESINIWQRLTPYTGDQNDETTLTSKGYIKDSGLLCYQLGIKSLYEVSNHKLWGHIFETFIVNALIRAVEKQEGAEIYYWRTADGSAEVDVIIKYNKMLYPIEIKASQEVTKSDNKGIRVYSNKYRDQLIADGLIISAGDLCHQLEKHPELSDDVSVTVVPWYYVF